jgi:hypothetical protein
MSVGYVFGPLDVERYDLTQSATDDEVVVVPDGRVVVRVDHHGADLAVSAEHNRIVDFVDGADVVVDPPAVDPDGGVTLRAGCTDVDHQHHDQPKRESSNHNQEVEIVC